MVVLCDSSVWIDALNGRRTDQTALLEAADADGRIVVGDLVLTEVLQGLREEHRFRATHRLLGRFNPVSLCGPDIAIQAAVNFRLLRSRGITIRGTIDVIIATWCIENGAAIIHNDRDMRLMEDHLGLRAYA